MTDEVRILRRMVTVALALTVAGFTVLALLLLEIIARLP